MAQVTLKEASRASDFRRGLGVRITDGYQNMFRIPELKQRILFTAVILIIYRLGSHIPVPGDGQHCAGWILRVPARGTLLGLYDMFAGR